VEMSLSSTAPGGYSENGNPDQNASREPSNEAAVRFVDELIAQQEHQEAALDAMSPEQLHVFLGYIGTRAPEAFDDAVEYAMNWSCID